MSDTPRTDGMTFVAQIGMMPPYDTVPAEFARQLERELNAAKELIREIRDNEVNAVDEATKFLRDYPIK
jgi:hypothetical protein